MKTSLCGAALAALLLACCRAPAEGGKPAKAGAPDGYDFVFFGESRPVLVRARVELDGKPLQAVWDDFIGRVFKYLDVNGDGVLSKEEAERAPLPQILLSGGGPFFGPPQMNSAPMMAALDANRDGKVTRQELADYYRKNGAPPFQFRMGGGGNGGMGTRVRLLGMAQTGTPSADALNERLFELLDTNKDGKLSRKELEAAPAVLAKLDADDDETVSVEEIMPTQALGGEGFVVVNSGDFVVPNNKSGVVMMLNPGEPRAALARQLLQRYAGKGGKKGAKKLTRADLGLDPATFDRLDADEDGALDAEELARFDRRPPDLELMVRLGTRPGGAPQIEVVKRDGKASPVAGNVRRSAAGATVLELGNTHLDLLADAKEDGNNAFFKVRIDQQYRAQFKAADRDGNGYLDEKEALASPFFRGIFKAMDRDGDGKLFEKEMLAYLDTMKELQAAAQKSFASLHVSDQGRGLFDLLDTNRDGRLGLREMRQMPKLLDRLDRDGDGALSRPEIPRSYRANFRQGPVANGNGFNGRAVFVVNRMGGRGPARQAPARGPKWFQKMDRNRDGDVSRREFLGTDEEFRKIDTDGDGLISLEEAEKADAMFRKAREVKR
ncbi:MAG TPA: EF-hand domain-containing protein [Gemmataceae bacterium]|jgi:Ca2+-binding EF-hand superfamily protein|nr:EF-hand domain-containing protein [Gemmataceae bacterium]